MFHKVTGINIDTNSVIVETDSQLEAVQEIQFDSLISTVPLDVVINMTNGEDGSLKNMKDLSSQLVYSHTHMIGIGLKGQPPQMLVNKSWMYFPDLILLSIE